MAVIAEAKGGAATAALAAAASALAAAQRRRRALIAAVAPARDVLLRRVVVPLASAAKARRVLPSLLDVQLPLPLESCVCSFPEAKPDGGGRVIALAAVAPKDAMARCVEQLQAIGLDPAVLAPEGLVLWRGSLCEMPPGDPALARIVVYAGADRWTAAAGIGDAFRWTATSAPPAGRDPAAAQAAAAPLLRRLRTDEDFRSVGLEWFWCGPAIPEGAALEAVEGAVAEGRRSSFRHHDEPSAFLARSLARAACDEAAAVGNLRAGGLTAPDLVAWRARREVRGWQALMAAGLVLAAVNGAGRAALARRAERAQAELARAAAAVAGVAPYGRELAAARAAFKTRGEEFAPFVRALRSPAAKALTALLDLAAEHEAVLYEIQASDSRLRVSGEAGGRSAAEALERGLAAEGWSVARQDDAGSAGRIAFTLQGERP